MLVCPEQSKHHSNLAANFVPSCPQEGTSSLGPKALQVDSQRMKEFQRLELRPLEYLQMHCLWLLTFS